MKALLILIFKRIVLFLSIISLVQILDVNTHDLSESNFYTNKVKKTLYLDRSFSTEEIINITAAATEWTNKTKGIVIFNIEVLSQISTLELDTSRSIFFIRTSPYSQEVIYLDSDDKETLGFYARWNIVPYIMLVTDRLTNESIYYAVVLHELGHSLGLTHDTVKGALMYPTVDYASTHLTDRDLQRFCNIYMCTLDGLKK